MITLERLGDDRVLITSDYPMRDKELLKSLPGSKYDLRAHVWSAPLTWATCQAMRGMFGDALRVGPELESWVREQWSGRIEPALKLRQVTSLEGSEDPWAEVVCGWRGYDYLERQ